MSSTTSTPNDSPSGTPIQPLHNPSQAAKIVHPQAPLGHLVNQAPGMGAKALLAKKMAKGLKPSFGISPTDNMMTPCSQKLSDAKKKHFTKGPKPVQLFAQKEESTDSDSEMDIEGRPQPTEKENKMNDDDENPF